MQRLKMEVREIYTKEDLPLSILYTNVVKELVSYLPTNCLIGITVTTGIV